MITIMQGDQYFIPFTFYYVDDETEERTLIEDDIVSDMLITIGGKTKSLSDGDIIYSDGEWLYPLLQTESLEFPPYVKVSARIKFSGENDVIGEQFGTIEVTPAAAKVEI